MGRGNIPDALIWEIADLVRKSARGTPPRIALHPHTVRLLLSVFSSSSLQAVPARQTQLVDDSGSASQEPAVPPPSASDVLPGMANAGIPLHGAVTACGSLDSIAAMVHECRKCPLQGTRTHAVPGEGNPRAQVVFVGEAPGADEDLQGRPFVGRAGQLLTDIIQKGMRLRREDVYICNVLKCRPPRNRTPAPDEVVRCMPYLVRQLDLLGPEVIVALGGVAAQALLDTRQPVGKLRGRWHAWRDIPLRVTFHPAYLLRNPHDKSEAWKDIQEVMRRLGLLPSGPSDG